MIKIAIVDDDENILNLVKKYVEQELELKNGNEILTFTNAKEFLQILQQGYEFDVLISDIEMPEMNGIELGKKVNQLCNQTYIIFLTSYSQYAAESYMIDAYQYIMKEDLENRLPVVLKRLITRIKKEKRQFRMIGTPSNKETVYYKNIVCISKEKGSKYVTYMTTNGIHKERIALNQLLEELYSEEFILVERAYIININHVVSMKGNIIYMDNGEEIISSRAHYKRVKEQINLYRGRLE